MTFFATAGHETVSRANHSRACHARSVQNRDVLFFILSVFLISYSHDGIFVMEIV